jgi:hypothetical protein
LLSQPSLI